MSSVQVKVSASSPPKGFPTNGVKQGWSPAYAFSVARLNGLGVPSVEAHKLLKVQ